MDAIIDIFNYELNTEHLFVTTGKQGSNYTNGKEFNIRKSFKTEIVDTIGAGDTFFAFASLCASLDDKIKDNNKPTSDIDLDDLNNLENELNDLAGDNDNSYSSYFKIVTTFGQNLKKRK